MIENNRKITMKGRIKVRKTKKESILLTQRCMEKLFEFIRSFMKRNEMKDVPTEFEFKGMDKEHATLVFNIWFSLDYITPFGKRFIEHFLEESKNLSREEREVLRELNKSFVSIYKVKNIKNDYFIVNDLINNEEHILLENEDNEMKIGYVFVGRIANILGNLELTGIATYFDPTAEKIMVDNINKYYNAFKVHNPHTTKNKFLKNFSNLVYQILDTIIEIYSEEEEEIPLEIKQQLDKFREHLNKNENLKESTVAKHVNKLFEFYWYYLSDTEKTLYDINGYIIDSFITYGIFDNFMTSKSDILSYITSIKKFGKYLKERDIINKKSYESIVKVAKNRDYYIREFHDYEEKSLDDIYDFSEMVLDDFQEDIDVLDENPSIAYDEELALIAGKYNSDKTSDFIADYEKYADYLSSNNVKATKINKYINRKHLLELNDIISNKVDTKKNINQKHTPILHLFFKFSHDKGIITIDDKDYINIGKKIDEYNKLNKEEKIAAFINYIWNEANWREFTDDNMIMNYEEYELRNEFIKIFSKLKIGKYYDFEKIRKKYKEEDVSKCQNPLLVFRYPMATAHVFNTKIIRYFSYIGLLDIQYREVKNSYYLMYGDDIDKIKISKFGREVFKYLHKNNQDIDISNVIDLFHYY